MFPFGIFNGLSSYLFCMVVSHNIYNYAVCFVLCMCCRFFPFAPIWLFFSVGANSRENCVFFKFPSPITWRGGVVALPRLCCPIHTLLNLLLLLQMCPICLDVIQISVMSKRQHAFSYMTSNGERSCVRSILVAMHVNIYVAPAWTNFS